MAKFYKLFTFCLFTLLLGSCQEGGEAGDLLGQWRLKGSDSQYIYFSGSVTMLRNLEVGEIYGNFQHVGDSLFIQCYSPDAAQKDTTVVESFVGAAAINDIRLKIDVLDGNNLVLSKDSRKWSFEKY